MTCYAEYCLYNKDYRCGCPQGIEISEDGKCMNYDEGKLSEQGDIEDGESGN